MTLFCFAPTLNTGGSMQRMTINNLIAFLWLILAVHSTTVTLTLSGTGRYRRGKYSTIRKKKMSEYVEVVLHRSGMERDPLFYDRDSNTMSCCVFKDILCSFMAGWKIFWYHILNFFYLFYFTSHWRTNQKVNFAPWVKCFFNFILLFYLFSFQEELRISSVYSVGGGNTFASPTGRLIYLFVVGTCFSHFNIRPDIL